MPQQSTPREYTEEQKNAAFAAVYEQIWDWFVEQAPPDARVPVRRWLATVPIEVYQSIITCFFKSNDTPESIAARKIICDSMDAWIASQVKLRDEPEAAMPAKLHPDVAASLKERQRRRLSEE